MLRRTKFAGAPELSEEASLQITSMADIFIIVLVFLLKTNISGVSSLAADRDLVLPEAKSQVAYQDALQVEIRREGVLVDQKLATTLHGFSFGHRGDDLSDIGPNEEIYRALIKGRTQNQVKSEETRILLLADERTPYATLNAVMESAAAAGYVDLQLAVVTR
jgi:biopolymer transport protein ExbD